MELKLINAILAAGAAESMTTRDIIKNEISLWENSKEKKAMLEAQEYYQNDTDILKRERKVIGESGQLEPVKNLANNKLSHGFLKKLVDQKVGYLLSKPLSIQTDNQDYLAELNYFFDKKMLRLIQNVGKESIIKGKAWMHIYYDQDGNLSFKRIPAEEIIPFWSDIEHTELDAVIRVYVVEVYEGKNKKDIAKVEFWNKEGVERYIYDGDLIPDVEATEYSPHFSVVVETEEGVWEKPFAWGKVPFICFKYNTEEIPLLKYIKPLIDDYDQQKSDNSNNLEDLPNSIYVVKNYSNTNGDDFRKNISIYRVVFTEGEGGVDTVNIEIDTEAYKTHMEMNRKDIYEFGRGVDTQQKEIGNSPSGIALKFLYADLDMDCNLIETEFQASLEQLLWFIDIHIANTTGKDYSNENVDFVFNRDIPINETEAITNAQSSIGVISDETIIANHPWVTNTAEEMERIKKQKQDNLSEVNSYPNLYNFIEGGADEE